MSVQSEDSRIQYSGDGITTVFSVPFYFFSEDDLKVVLKSESGAETYLERGLDFSVDGAGNEEGGEVVMAMSPGAGTEVTIYREIEVTQTTVYGENAEFPAKSHERALDKLTMICQQIARNLAATFRLRESDGDATEAAKKINSVFGLDASGNPLFRTPSELVAWVNLTTPVLNFPTKTFADAAERATAIPDFIGQIGTQRDNRTIHVSTDTVAGAWIVLLPGEDTIDLAMLGDGILGNSSEGRSKMEDGYLSANTEGRAKMADAFVTLKKINAGIFTADAIGRGKFAPGFVDPWLCESGLWRAIAPSGVPLQSVSVESNAYSTSTAIIPLDNTKPQSSEGIQILSVTITPFSASNKIRLMVCPAVNSDNPYTVAMFRDSGLDAIAARTYQSPYLICPPFVFEDFPSTTDSVTYKVRAGASTGTMHINGIYYYTQVMNGTIRSVLIAEEIKA